MSTQTRAAMRRRTTTLIVVAVILGIGTLVLSSLVFSARLGFGQALLAVLFILPIAALVAAVAAIVTGVRTARMPVDS